VIEPAEGESPEGEAFVAHSENERLVNSGPFSGRPASEAIAEVIAWLEQEGKGKPAVHYRLRDWLVSRQRYWGCPIPIVYCEQNCNGVGIVPVPEDQLPIELPEVEDYAPKGKSPLAAVEDWVQTTCPKCGGPARRETDTMDTFVDSAWYFLRYLDAHNDSAAFEREIADYWMPVDQYIGGVEHAILHLMYARFLTKALADLGHLGVQEPFASLFTQGMITRDGAKMSKSRGNTVSPAEYVQRYGADAIRVYICSMGPPEGGGDWSDEGIGGSHRFLSRLATLAREVDERTSPSGEPPSEPTGEARELMAKAHWAIDKVTADIERAFHFHTAIAAVIELVNDCYRLKDGLFGSAAGDASLRFATATAASLIFPFAPHLGADIYERLEGDRVWEQPWPRADPALLVRDTFQLVVQVNGKVRDRVEAPSAADEAELLRLAHASERVRQHLEGKEVVKEIVVPGKLVNLVVR
jgi:leucyl-tRNA synthetase